VVLTTYRPNPICGARSAARRCASTGVGEVEAPVQVLVRLEVQIVVRAPQLGVVVRLRKEPGGPQHDAGQAFRAEEELAEVLRRLLRHPVDVPRDAGDPFVDPGRGSAVGRPERGAEGARGAAQDEAGGAALERGLEQGEGSGDVGLDEGLLRVRRHVRLVEGGGVDDEIGAAQAASDEVRIRNRADVGREGGIDEVQPHDVRSALPQGPDETLAEMPGASGHEHAHRAETPFPLPDA
jgi:hypothetical protein